ncbi:hypothetical protein KSS87_018772, partial [Heliosperma pusillum]
LNLSGSIIARCGNTYGQKYPGIVLLETLSNQPIETSSNNPIDLSRDVLVVPAYSFLRINLHLSQHLLGQQEDIICQEEFLAGHLYNKDVRDIKVKDFVVRFYVEWCHPYELKNDSKESFTGLQLHNYSLLKPGNEIGPLLEVYSVMIHHNTDCKLIHGSLTIIDPCSISSLSFPLTYSGCEKKIPIGAMMHCLYTSEYFSMRLELKDNEGKVLVEGGISWTDSLVEQPMSWYDKRICSVIRGVHGYAAVFYTIFSKAIEVVIRVSVESSGYHDVKHCFSGSVVARPGTYLSVHDKTYYERVLFQGNCSDVRLPYFLGEFSTAMPIEAALIVGVDISVSPCLPVAILKEDLTFDMAPAIQRRRIIHNGHCVEVSVQCFALRNIFSESCY